MLDPLTREFSIAATFRLSLAAWARNVVPFTLLTAIVYLPLVGWGVSVTRGAPELHALQMFAGLSGAIVAILNTLLSAALTYGVVMELREERASIGACIVVGLKRFLPVIGVSFLVTLAIVGGTLLLLIPGIIVTCMLYVAIPASIVERPGLLGALRRSRDLTRGHRMQIFGLYLLSALVIGISGTILQRVVLGDAAAATPARWPTFVYAELGRRVVVGPFAAVIPAVAYFLLRQEKEGAPVNQLARVFE